MTDITSDDILGKVALDVDGGLLGVIVKLHIDKQQRKVTGITIDQGFLKPDLFVGVDYIKQFGIDAIFLNDLPVATLKGVEVINCLGNIVGTVKKVASKHNQLNSVHVIGKGSYKGKTIDIPKKFISEIGSRIVLKKNWKE